MRKLEVAATWLVAAFVLFFILGSIAGVVKDSKREAPSVRATESK